MYWLGLGVASSVGLGTGLHTFVLYLGPHIAKIVLAANECQSMPEYVPSRWKFDHFAPCSASSAEETITFFQLYKEVILEAFLWGAGTAIGELPPYFIARAASMAGQKTEECATVFNEIEEAEGNKTQPGIMDKMKAIMMRWLKRNAFITVLVAASVSN